MDRASITTVKTANFGGTQVDQQEIFPSNVQKNSISNYLGFRESINPNNNNNLIQQPQNLMIGSNLYRQSTPNLQRSTPLQLLTQKSDNQSNNQGWDLQRQSLQGSDQQAEIYYQPQQEQQQRLSSYLPPISEQPNERSTTQSLPSNKFRQSTPSRLGSTASPSLQYNSIDQNNRLIQQQESSFQQPLIQNEFSDQNKLLTSSSSNDLQQQTLMEQLQYAKKKNEEYNQLIRNQSKIFEEQKSKLEFQQSQIEQLNQELANMKNELNAVTSQKLQESAIYENQVKEIQSQLELKQQQINHLNIELCSVKNSQITRSQNYEQGQFHSEKEQELNQLKQTLINQSVKMDQENNSQRKEVETLKQQNQQIMQELREMKNLYQQQQQQSQFIGNGSIMNNEAQTEQGTYKQESEDETMMKLREMEQNHKQNQETLQNMNMLQREYQYIKSENAELRRRIVDLNQSRQNEGHYLLEIKRLRNILAKREQDSSTMITNQSLADPIYTPSDQNWNGQYSQQQKLQTSSFHNQQQHQQAVKLEEENQHLRNHMQVVLNEQSLMQQKMQQLETQTQQLIIQNRKLIENLKQKENGSLFC